MVFEAKNFENGDLLFTIVYYLLLFIVYYLLFSIEGFVRRLAFCTHESHQKEHFLSFFNVPFNCMHKDSVNV